MRLSSVFVIANYIPTSCVPRVRIDVVVVTHQIRMPRTAICGTLDSIPVKTAWLSCLFEFELGSFDGLDSTTLVRLPSYLSAILPQLAAELD